MERQAIILLVNRFYREWLVSNDETYFKDELEKLLPDYKFGFVQNHLIGEWILLN